LRGGCDAETSVQAQDRQQSPAHERHLAAIGHRRERGGGGPEHFLHDKYRNDVTVLSHAHYQAFDNRQGERQFDDEPGAMTGPGRNFDAATQLDDLFAYHIHSDAAAGNVGDLRGGGEPRLEDKAEHLFIGETLPARNQAALLSLGENFFARQAPPVVSDFDVDESTLMVSLQV